MNLGRKYPHGLGLVQAKKKGPHKESPKPHRRSRYVDKPLSLDRFNLLQLTIQSFAVNT